MSARLAGAARRRLGERRANDGLPGVQVMRYRMYVPFLLSLSLPHNSSHHVFLTVSVPF